MTRFIHLSLSFIALVSLGARADVAEQLGQPASVSTTIQISVNLSDHASLNQERAPRVTGAFARCVTKQQNLLMRHSCNPHAFHATVEYQSTKTQSGQRMLVVRAI